MPEVDPHRRTLLGHATRNAASMLVLLVAVTVLAFAVEDKPWLSFLYILFVCVVVLQAIRVANARRPVTRVIDVICAAVIIVTFVEAVTGKDVFEGSTTLFAGILLALVPVALARRLIEQREVTLNAVLSVITIYFVFGLVYSFAYATLDRVSAHPALVGERLNNFDFIYFSFVTLTTTGYGDLTAATNVGRALAVSEALIGQIFLVTVVARLVSLWVPLRRRGSDEDDDGRDG